MSAAPPKVMFVIHQIGSGADGGIRSIAEMIRAVPELDKLIVTNIEGPATDRLRAAGPVALWDMAEPAYGLRLTPLRRLAQIRSRARNNLRTFYAVRREGVSVIHANDQYAFWSSALGARLGGAKIIFNVRGAMRSESRWKSKWRRALDLSDRFLLLSQEMIDAWRRDLMPAADRPANRGKFTFIHSIVDAELFTPATQRERAALRAELGIDDSRPTLLYIGRFDVTKAQLAFIENSVIELRRLRPDTIVYFVGDFEPRLNPYAAACAAVVERLGLADTVRFVGYSARTADWYRAADIVLLASRREGLPRCMIESLACGSAFISFDVCSTREVVEAHDCGLVVAQGDYAGLAHACAALLGDPKRLARYRANGPVVARRLFDAETNGARYLDLLASLGGTPRR